MTSQKNGHHTFDGCPVLIGSLPLRSHEEALEWILKATPEIPLWPQLPSNPVERMLPQFAEGIPCIREENPASQEDGKVYFDTAYPDFDEAMLAFYEDYLAAAENQAALDNSRFAISRDRGAGLYLLADKIQELAESKAVKGQITGPFTMLTGIKDNQGRAGYFDETVRDMVSKAIAMKAAWQVRLLGRDSSGPVLLFIDEPALAGLGSSAFISVTTEDIREMINETAAAIHLAGGLAGIHVCANTDWGLLLDSEIDILSFDAYDFFDRIAPLREEMLSFLDRGGIIAWGGIPTSREEDITRETADSLVKLWHEQMTVFTGSGRDEKDILRQTLITPSCGTGSLSPELAERVLALTREVSRKLRKELLVG
ncbi:MAG: hypothetical protein SCH71_15770 [Desulfobulbaceae bacterium]|nr:hypothetical protein [Desulfobulbaceae bacterium]